MYTVLNCYIPFRAICDRYRRYQFMGIGTDMIRVDAADKVKGAAKYTSEGSAGSKSSAQHHCQRGSKEL